MNKALDKRVVVVIFFAVVLGRGAGAPLATFECRETLGRDWPRTLVTYAVEFKPGQVQVGGLRLEDSDGQEQPCQLWRVKTFDDGSMQSARLSFFAELKSNSRYHFQLLPGQPAALRNPPSAKITDGFLVLENSKTAIRLPHTGRKNFPTPLLFYTDHTKAVADYRQRATAERALGPIIGIRLVDGRWAGGSYFFAANPDLAPKVTGYTCRLTEQGPLFVEAKVHYTFDQGGWYEFTARVLAEDPALRIDEQFDMGAPGSLWDYRMMVSLTSGWQQSGWKPDAAYWISTEERLKGRDEPFQAKLREAGLKVPPDCGSTPIRYADAYQKLFDVAVRYPWNPNAQFFGLVNSSHLSVHAIAQDRVPFVAVVPMHTGNWRGSIDPMDGMLFSYPLGDVCLNWRLRASPHPRSMLHTGEYDPEQPLTYCRRQWALIGGSFQSFEQLWAFRAQEGHVTLDDYKDWIFDWQPTDARGTFSDMESSTARLKPQPVTYPRLLFSKADVERLRPQMDRFPAGDQFRQFLYVNETDQRREALWNKLSKGGEWDSPSGMIRNLLSRGDPSNIPWAIGYRMSQMAGWVGDMDELLSSEKLTPEQRTKLRRDLAALCYTLTEPDVNPRGSMTHLGNPNMPINRFCGLAWVAALIPDHPLAKTWLDTAAQYIRYKLAMNTAPNGTWGELISYYTASAPHLIQTASVLARTGRLDESTARLAVRPAQFTLHLLTPRDPRFDARIVPGWGHEGLDQGIQFLVAANTVRAIDPQLAASLVWAWDQFGRPMSGHHDAGFSPRAQANVELLRTLPAGYAPPQLKSTWLPGFGVTMRAHAGDSNETYLSFRQGYSVSHCDENQGDFVLYAKQAPLVSLSLVGYAVHGDGPFAQLYKTFGWHSRVRLGSMTNTGGWLGGGALGGVPVHAFNDSIDYARAIGNYGPQRWTRQIAFLKGQAALGPNYFVFRDGFGPILGELDPLEPKWWYLRTLGTKDQVRAGDNELNYQSAFGSKLNVHFLQPNRIQAQSRDAVQSLPLYHVTARNWVRAGSPVIKKESDINVTGEDKMTVTAVGPLASGQDVLVVLYPQTKDEAAPRYESLADGIARVTTREATDYIFLSTKPIQFNQGDIGFHGQAGAIRILTNEVHLILSEGPGTISYRGTTLRAETSALKIVPMNDLEQKQSFDLAAPWQLKHTELPPGCRIAGPARCETAITNDRITGRSEGQGGFLYAPMPPGMKVLPTLVIDGQTYAPGTSGGTLIIPLLPGEHIFEVRALEQPPIFRNWQHW